MRLTNRVLMVNNRRTTMRLSLQEWTALDDVCLRENMRRNKLISMIDNGKAERLGLSYATRLFLLLYYQSLAKPINEKQALQIIEKLKS